MTNAIAPLACIAALGAAILVGVNANPGLQPKHNKPIEQVLTQTDANVWVLASTETQAVCLLFKTRKITNSTTKVSVDPACEEIFANSADIAVWQQDLQGNVLLGDEQGNPLAEFSPEENGLISARKLAGRLTLSPNS